MDGISRSAQPSRWQQLFGLQAEARMLPRTRPAPDERVDIPEIQESTRVSFSQGASVQRGGGARAGTDLYRSVAAL